MALLCTFSGKVLDRDGAAAAGVRIRADQVFVNGVRDTDYEVNAAADTSGIFSFSMPQGARVRFTSNAVSGINGWTYTVPNTGATSIGNWLCDSVSEADQYAYAGTPEAGVTATEYGDAAARKTVFTFSSFLVTLVKNGTSTGGGGSKIYTFPQGLILPKGGSSNLTIAADGDASFLASVGSAAADTGGTLTSTEISFLPSTAATTSSGAGTCKMKSTSTIPTPGAPLDGTTTPVPVYLNSALNADATEIEALRYSGTITIHWEHLGDN